MLILNKIKKGIAPHLELICWITALALLFFMDSGEQGPSLCFFKFIGFNSCPGCGLGHSIHHALHLRFGQSFQAHWFGIAATLIILHRIKQLINPKTLSVYEI